jgi:ATP-dependent RNA helicase DOB1
MVIDDEESIEDYYNLRLQIDSLKQDMRDVMNHEAYCLPFLQPGRLVRIKLPKSTPNQPLAVLPTANEHGTNPSDLAASTTEEQEKPEELDFGWGVIINFQKRIPQVKGKDMTQAFEGPKYVVDVLLHCAPGPDAANYTPSQSASARAALRPCPSDVPAGEMVIVPCDLSCIDGLSMVRVFMPKDMKSAENRNQMRKTIKEVEKRFPDGVPLLDPMEDMGIKDDGFKKLIKVSILNKICIPTVENPIFIYLSCL